MKCFCEHCNVMADYDVVKKNRIIPGIWRAGGNTGFCGCM